MEQENICRGKKLSKRNNYIHLYVVGDMTRDMKFDVLRLDGVRKEKFKKLLSPLGLQANDETSKGLTNTVRKNRQCNS